MREDLDSHCSKEKCRDISGRKMSFIISVCSITIKFNSHREFTIFNFGIINVDLES